MLCVSMILFGVAIGAYGLGPSDCTRSDTAFATAADGMDSLDGWTRLVPTASVSAGASGLAIVQAPSQLSGVVAGKGAWRPPFEITFAVSIENMIDTTGPDTGSVAGSFFLVDADSKPDPEHAAAGCQEVAFTFYGKTQMAASLACCAKDCAAAKWKSGSSAAESGEDQEYVGTFGDKQTMQIRDAPNVGDVNTWTIAVTDKDVSFAWRSVKHVIAREPGGVWPGDDTPAGLRPAFVMVLPAKDGQLATMLLPSVSIQGCSVSTTQTQAPTAAQPPQTQQSYSNLAPTSATLPAIALSSQAALAPSPSAPPKKIVVVSGPEGRASPLRVRQDGIVSLIALAVVLCLVGSAMYRM